MPLNAMGKQAEAGPCDHASAGQMQGLPVARGARDTEVARRSTRGNKTEDPSDMPLNSEGSSEAAESGRQ